MGRYVEKKRKQNEKKKKYAKQKSLNSDLFLFTEKMFFFLFYLICFSSSQFSSFLQLIELFHIGRNSEIMKTNSAYFS